MTPDEKAIFHAALRLLDTFTKTEARLIGSLMLAYPSALSVDQLALLSPSHKYVNDPHNLLRVNIQRLRKKLPPGTTIVTIRSGYKLEYVDGNSS